jgi:malonyl-CoA O-methyltransferase
MLRYIKRSGVSGGRNVLGVTQMRRLMERYPLEYLEFEVLFIRT